MSRGYSFIEVVVVLGLVGILISIGLPVVHRARDSVAVHAAIAALTSAIAEARVLAVTSGGAEVRLGQSPPRVTVTVRDSIVRSQPIGDGRNVSMSLPGGRAEWVLRYDPLGIGRMGSSTLRLQSGQVTGLLLVSAYGRVRRR